MTQTQSALPAALARLFHLHRQAEMEQTKKYNDLKHDLETAKSNLHTAMTNFDNVADPKLVDLYIYRIQAAQTQYEHILHEIKKLG